jgi:bifunctional polynucleotide phosphatase/kinase
MSFNLQIKNFNSKKDDSKLHILTPDKSFVLCPKIAAFDLDHTLIRPKGSSKTKKFPKNRDDWVWTDLRWPSIIQELYNTGMYSIIIFSNQAGLSRGHPKLEDLHYKINNIVKEIGVPIQVFLAPQKDKFRKPGVSIWNFMLHLHRKSKPKIDLSGSFYIGDAAGRSSDFSNSDQKFAENIGIQFYTPEDFIRHYYLNKYLSINPELIILKSEGTAASLKLCKDFFDTELMNSGYKLISGGTDELGIISSGLILRYLLR